MLGETCCSMLIFCSQLASCDTEPRNSVGRWASECGRALWVGSPAPSNFLCSPKVSEELRISLFFTREMGFTALEDINGLWNWIWQSVWGGRKNDSTWRWTYLLVRIMKCVQAWLTLTQVFNPQAHQLIVFIRSANPRKKKICQRLLNTKTPLQALEDPELWTLGLEHRKSITKGSTSIFVGYL